MLAQRWAGFALMVLGVAGCSPQHVQLKFPDTSPGEQFVCSAAKSGEQRCTPRTDLDPAADNRHGTVFVIMPRECRGSFHEITIHDAGSSEPKVNVKCAPLENVVQ